MLILALAYLGGVLTIVSPCILPVLPFVFARADRPFRSNGLPMLVGMAVTFSGVAVLAAVGGGWAVQANQYGRYAALALLAVFGLALLLPDLTARVTQPIVAFGASLSRSTDARASSGGDWRSSLVIGVATGLLWAPCAGPILGLILTGAALQGANTRTALLLLAYAAGAATSLALALLIGGRVFTTMKRSLGVGEWVRRGLGVLMLAAVVAIASGLDAGFLTRVSLAGTTSLETRLVSRFHRPLPPTPSAPEGATLPVLGPMPSLDGATTWLNSAPLSTASLRGKVVVVDFWTYSCINCLRSIPYVEAWAEKYRDLGLVVIGVHTPEFAFEKNVDNIRKAIADFKITYPVAVDSDYTIWRAFDNEYWPAHYFIDVKGQIRYTHFGEGEYDDSEAVIQTLLEEAGRTVTSDLGAVVKGSGAEVPSDPGNLKSPETYVGYEKLARFASGPIARDASHAYNAAATLKLNEWGLAGRWTMGPEHASLDAAGGAIRFRFHARDLHLVLGPGPSNGPVRFRVTIDGHPLGDAHGTDTDRNGDGVVTGQRLYQLIRQVGPIADHTFEIVFLDPGVQAFAFTFG